MSESRAQGEDKPRDTVTDREEKVLAFWKEKDIFHKSERGRDDGWLRSLYHRFFQRKQFVFYDGPPFATGLPHYGHILAGTVKDAVPRYKTMRGYTVRRRWGWDCHGLPLEVEMEKQIGSTSKKDIEQYGIEKFNRGIRNVIFKYADEWRSIVPRLGRWVDMDNDYRTVNTPYIESVWWVFRRLHERGLVSKGFKVSHLCPRCSTTLANAEVADSYEMLTDTAVFVLFPLKEDPDTFLVAWTTTPWTLFGNVALGIGEDITYAVVEQDGKRYVVHERMTHLFPAGEVVAREKGSAFVGKEYLPALDALFSGDRKPALWRVYAVPYIDTEVGTGIVHLAPAYGADDLETAQKHGLPVRHHVTPNGEFVPELGAFAGLRPKEKGNPRETEEKILDALREKGVLLKSEELTHAYPVCWRCSTPLLNYAADSWLVHADRYRDQMAAENRKVRWVPEHIRDGRFGHWLAQAQPWAVSRQRFWGAPLPVWRVEKTGEHLVIGSLKEMFERMRADNSFTFVRHGHSVSNQEKTFRCLPEDGYGLTETGREQARRVAEKLADTAPAVIFCSPLTRARETAEYIAEQTGAKIIEDPLLIEMQVPEMHGKTHADLMALTKKSGAGSDMRCKIGTGESYNDLYLRTLQFLEKVSRQYRGAHIVVVAHKVQQVAAWRADAPTASFKYAEVKRDLAEIAGNAEPFTLAYKSVRRDADGALDLHRPYIDDVVLYDDDGNPAHHIKEVFDCWFESGAMPYGSHHYPFASTAHFHPEEGRGFPADFICEGLDQTRGWFYSLLAISVGAFNAAPYRHVIATGIIRASDGKKMSKRLKNYADPMELVGQYGADALRHYLLGSPAVRGEALDFNDGQVVDIYKKVYARLHNCFNFYTTYAHLPRQPGSNHPLDRYILSRLAETRESMTDGFETYHLDTAVSPISAFVEDLSVWYIRRSRDRMRHDTKDGAYARQTLHTVLTEFAKCLAPVAPFYAEHLYLALRKYQHRAVPESVHLCAWPESMPVDTDILRNMRTARDIVSVVHDQRSRAGIKVRQPLRSVTIRCPLPDEIQAVIAEEVNVKDITVDPDADREAVLHTELTPELRAEGFVREYIRNVQSMRKDMGLSLTETLSSMRVSAPTEQAEHLRQFEEKIKRETRVDDIVYVSGDIDGGRTMTIEGVVLSVRLLEQPGEMFR